LFLSSGLRSAVNMIDHFPSRVDQVQMKIWFGDRVLVTYSISLPQPFELLRVRMGIELLWRFWKWPRVAWLVPRWMDACRYLEEVRNWLLLKVTFNFNVFSSPTGDGVWFFVELHYHNISLKLAITRYSNSAIDLAAILLFHNIRFSSYKHKVSCPKQCVKTQLHECPWSEYSMPCTNALLFDYTEIQIAAS